MKTIIFNDDNLQENQIEDTVLKARAVIINDKHEILLSQCAGFYLFPGGKLSENECAEEGLIREIKEETGISPEKNMIKPLVRIKHIIKHYPKRHEDNAFGNRENITDYYLVQTNQNVDKTEMDLTEYEKKGGFKTIKVKIEEIPTLIGNLSGDIRSRCYAREISAIVSEIKKLKNIII
ncbi:MAG: NUDIX domain-containing protein [Clostridia bacterium]|nr:NUDIX domain-containing protein [Clostridia bacterium]